MNRHHQFLAVVGAVAVFTSFAVAQPVVAPTNAPLGTVRGEDAGEYNITNSFELGYRFRSVGGFLGKYRSDVNYGNGLRLLSGNLTVNSKDGHGKYFDQLLLSTQGLGNDPYQFSSLRIGKNRLYRYDFTWRLNEYYNPALTIASGQHFRDTRRMLSDHNLVLLPESPFKVFLGYSNVNQTGPGLSTLNLFDSRGDIFPLFEDIQRRQNEYRVGFEANVFGAKISVLKTWEYFRDDTRDTSAGHPGNDPGDAVTLTSLRRDQPYHGSTSGWRGNILWDRSKFVTVSGRITYAGGRRDFIYDESITGTQRFGTGRNQQILVFGNARRPVTTGSVAVTFFPTSQLTISNNTAVHSTRMDGDGTYRQFDAQTLSLENVDFQYLGIRTITNATDVNYRATKVFGVFAGYQYSDRRIRSIEQTAFSGDAEREAFEQSNQLNAGRVGVRVQPVKPLTFIVDAEIGRANRPIYPTSERNYHALGGRIQYKRGTLLMSAYTRANYNTNSVALTSYSSRTRTWAADLSWTARPWLSFDASYSKLHLDTLGGIAYFFNSELVNDYSKYISNIHTGYFGARIAAGSRAEITLGYSRVQDTGDGRNIGPAAPYVLGITPAVLEPLALAYQTYPLSFESPFGKLSIRINRRIRWNAGYQHYRYNEDLLPIQNYRAHTGYTSISWMF